MFKARSTNTGILSFDTRQPISVITAGQSRRVFLARIGLVLNPLAALRSDAANIRVQILSKTHQNPTTLDGVTERNDIMDNIKTISTETTQKYDDFLADGVLAEQVFTVTSILTLMSPELAYEYSEGSDLSVVAEKLPQTDVVTVRRRTKKRQLKNATEIIPEKTFTYPELEGAFSSANIPPGLNINTQGVERWALIAPQYGKTLSNIMHYPFPVSETLAQYRDTFTCQWADFDQQNGMRFLEDSDFVGTAATTVVPDGSTSTATTSPIGMGTVNLPVVVHPSYESDPIARTAHPASTLNTVYEEFIAYDDTSVEDVFLTTRKMKLLPFIREFPFITDVRVSDNIILKITVTNPNGVVLSTLYKDVYLTPLLADTSRPMQAPDIEVALPNAGSGQDDATMVGINITQRDVSATRIALLVKESPKLRFKTIGSYELRTDESLQLFVNPRALRGTVIFRAIAVLDADRSSSAFTDKPVSIGMFQDLAKGDGGKDQDRDPGITTGLRLRATVKYTGEHT